MNRLIFVDTETTGLNEGKDHILELALVAVELPTFAVVAQGSWLVTPPMWPTVKRNMNERVLKMHTNSGLIAELESKARLSTLEVEREACSFVTRESPRTMEWHTPLAGAGPDFDRRFISKHMPKLVGLFHYRNFDVRSLTQIQDWVFGVKHVESPHRALPDCLKAIEDVRNFLGCP